MPYISKERRQDLDAESALVETEGELNYAITRLAHHYVRRKGPSYANMNAAYGAMMAAAAEFYRTVVAPYENVKAIANGPVSSLDKEFFDKVKDAQ